MWADLAYSLSAGRDKTLTGRSGRLQDLLHSFSGDTPHRRVTKFADFAEATPEGNLIQVFDSRGTRIYPPASWSAIDFPWPHWTIASGRQFSDLQYSGRHFRVLSYSTRVGPDIFRLFVAGQLEDNRVLLDRFATGLLWATPALLVLSAFCGYFLSRRAMGPVARLTASARSISVGNLSRRLPIFHTGDELQKLAETCNEMLARLEGAVNQITRFTADASHELRSPISFIRTISEYALRNAELDAESAESFREIVQETTEAARLLEDLLALARADAGHVETVFERVDLAEILLDTCARARHLADAKHHRMLAEAGHDGPVWITGDASSLRRLVWILLDNAVKYTPQGGQIEVSLRVTHTEALLSVQDSGIGISDAALPHIFERFYRVDKARGLEEGTGLGLSIAKWISDIHHAAMSVKSTEKCGSTFLVAFHLLSVR